MRFGPTSTAPPPVRPSSASYMSNGRRAPRPTKIPPVTTLFACLPGTSVESAATALDTSYVPLPAVQVPRFTDPLVAPAAIAPLIEPVSVLTTVPVVESLMVTVRPCAAVDVAMLPLLATAPVNVTTAPAAGLLGDQLTTGTRSELATGATTSLVGLL